MTLSMALLVTEKDHTILRALRRLASAFSVNLPLLGVSRDANHGQTCIAKVLLLIFQMRHTAPILACINGGGRGPQVGQEKSTP